MFLIPSVKAFLQFNNLGQRHDCRDILLVMDDE